MDEVSADEQFASVFEAGNLRTDDRSGHVRNVRAAPGGRPTRQRLHALGGTLLDDPAHVAAYDRVWPDLADRAADEQAGR